MTTQPVIHPDLTIAMRAYPLLTSLVVVFLIAFFTAAGVFLVVTSIRQRGGRRAWGLASRDGCVGLFTVVACVVVALLCWMFWPPSTVELKSDAAVVRWFWTSSRVPYDAIRSVRYEVRRSRYRGPKEIHVVRLTTAGAVYEIDSEKQSPGSEAFKSVKQLYGELIRRLPPDVIEKQRD